MKFELSIHAKKVISQREIPMEWIEKILSNPEKIEKDRHDDELSHHLGKIPEFGNRILRVVFNDTESPVIIVTVYFDRDMRRKL